MYLNMCVSESSLEDLGVPRETVVLYLEPILLELNGRRYIVPGSLAELVGGSRGGISGRSGRGSGNGIGDIISSGSRRSRGSG